MTKILITIGVCFAQLVTGIGIDHVYSNESKGRKYTITDSRCTQGGAGVIPLKSIKFSVESSIGSILGNISMENDKFTIEKVNLASQNYSNRPSASNLVRAHVYPNPFKSYEGHNEIHFTRLSKEVTIRIYTISGELVRTLDKDDITSDEIKWDGKNDNGTPVFSGTYLYYIKSDTEISRGKIMIIR